MWRQACSVEARLCGDRLVVWGHICLCGDRLVVWRQLCVETGL